jgi:hypothetical protein
MGSSYKWRCARSGRWPRGRWKSAIGEEDLGWARRHMAPGGSPAERWLDSPDLILYFKPEESHPHAVVGLDEQYTFREVYQRALTEDNPTLAPHVQFKTLEHGNNAAALGFLQEYGPLFRVTGSQGERVDVDLNDFWRKHLRFFAVVELFESAQDPERLRAAWSWIDAMIDVINEAEPKPLGYIPQPDGGFAVIDIPELLRNASPRDLRGTAHDLILSELALQSDARLRTNWESTYEDDAPFSFRPTRVVTSLWAVMWEMFGLDTWRGWGWNSCRICSRYFYPRQANSECCTPQHQALWSKREWARKNRSGSVSAKAPG